MGIQSSMNENNLQLDLEKDCPQDHRKLVTFDPKLARNLSSAEIRRRWPRIQCNTCDTMVYASQDHYVAGDW